MMQLVRLPPSRPQRPRPLQKLTFECSVCTYGIVRPAPPEVCPMCRSSGMWVHAPWRPFSRGTA